MTTQQILIYAAILVALALVVALIARALAGRKKPGELPPPAEKERIPELPRPPVAVPRVELPPERLEREAKARADVDAASRTLAEARARNAPEAELQRLARAADEAARKLDYEVKKREEAEAKAQRKAEADARAAQEAAERAAEEERQRQAKLAEEEARRKLVAQEAGRTLSEGLAKTRGGFMARLNAFVTGAKELDDAALAELEEILFSADIGVRTATDLLERIRRVLAVKAIQSRRNLRAGEP